MKYLFALLLSLNAFAICEDSYNVKTEKNKDVIFCSVDELQLSKKCSESVQDCKLVKDLKVKNLRSKLFDSSVTGNPGSRICNALSWKVHMGTLFDESQVCTCLHPDGEYITCSSLSEFYQKKVKAKK